MTFPIGWSLEDSYTLFRIDGGDAISPYPLEVVVDRQGIIRYVSREFDLAALESIVEEVVAEP